MICACSLAGTAACASCSNNPNKANQYGVNFITWDNNTERTCEPKWILQGTTQTQEFWRCECGNCGECFGVEDRSSFPFKMTIDEVDIPNYCPSCGAKVRDE